MAAKAKSNKKLIEFLIFLLIAAAILFMLKASYIKSKPMNHINMPMHQIAGVYKGQLPCADCTGIEETITLTASNSAQTMGSFVQEDLYQGKQTKPFQTSGSWKLLSNNVLEFTLNLPTPQPQYFKVQPNGDITMLGQDMQPIDSPFNQTLTKQ